MTDLVKLYNPANSASLTEEQILGLQNLNSTELKELAIAYPNMTMNRAYLLIIDGSKPAENQLPTLSTFENLWNLRERNGLKDYVAFNFKGAYRPTPAMTNVKVKRQEVLDLSETELMSLPGFKTANTSHAPQEVLVKKINKTALETETGTEEIISKDSKNTKLKKIKSI